MRIFRLYVMIERRYDLFLKWIQNASKEELTETRYNFHDRAVTCLLLSQKIFKDVDKMSNIELNKLLYKYRVYDHIYFDIGLKNFDSTMGKIRNSKILQSEIVNKVYYDTETTFRKALKEYRPNIYDELFPKPGPKFIAGAVMGTLTLLLIPVALIALIVKACS